MMPYIRAKGIYAFVQHHSVPAFCGLPPPLLLLFPAEFSAPPSVSLLGFETSGFAGETSNGFPDV